MKQLGRVEIGLVLLGAAVLVVLRALADVPSLLPVIPVVQSQGIPQGQPLPIKAQFRFGQAVIQLEVAHTPEQQATGLMYRNTLAKDRGMLFPFEPPQIVSFWMKNVKIPLDMLFLFKGEVKAIAPRVPPCQQSPCPTYGPDQLIDQVIELRGGRAAELGIQVGDRLQIDFLESAAARLFEEGSRTVEVP